MASKGATLSTPSQQKKVTVNKGAGLSTPSQTVLSPNKPKPKGTTGASLTTPSQHPNPSGGAPVAAGTHPVTTLHFAQPYATPDQTAAYLNAMSGYAGQLTDLNTQYNQAPKDELLAESNNVHDSAVSKEQANALAAARGQFGTGVNAGDLTDIAAKLTLANTTLQNNLASLQSSLLGKIAAINGPGGLEQIAQNQYMGEQVQNAAAIDPTSTTAQVPNSTGSTAPLPTQPKPAGPTPIAKPTPQPASHAQVKPPTQPQHGVAGALSTPSQNVPLPGSKKSTGAAINFPRGMGAF